jgi:hypothetical protein
MMSMLCNYCVCELLILARTWFAFGLPSKTGCDSLTEDNEEEDAGTMGCGFVNPPHYRRGIERTPVSSASSYPHSHDPRPPMNPTNTN